MSESNPPKIPISNRERKKMLQASIVRLAAFRKDPVSAIRRLRDPVDWVTKHFQSGTGRPFRASSYGPALRLAHKIVRLRQAPAAED